MNTIIIAVGLILNFIIILDAIKGEHFESVLEGVIHIALMFIPWAIVTLWCLGWLINKLDDGAP